MRYPCLFLLLFAAQPAWLQASADSATLQSGYYVLLLLNEDLVQDDLGLSDRQREIVENRAQEFLRRLHYLWKQVELNGKGNKLGQQRLREELDTFTAQALHHLTAEQKQRLSQIAFQLQGVQVLYDQDVQQHLGLTPDQKRQVRELRVSIIREIQEQRRQWQEPVESAS